MQTRPLILGLAVLALLAVYVWWSETRDGDDADLSALDEGEEELLPGVEAEDVQGMRLESGGRQIELRRQDEGWLLAGDVERRADSELADAAVRSAAGLVSTRRLADGDPQAFGLGATALRVSIEVDDAEPVTIIVGGGTPVGSGRYLAVEGSPTVHVVDSWSLTALERDLLDFQDRHLLWLAPEELSRIELTTPDGSLAISRTDRHWFVDGDSPWRVETSRARELAIGLADLTAATFVDPSPTPTDDWSRIAITDAQGASAELWLSPPSPAGVRTAVASGPLSAARAATVETDLADDLSPDLGVWRAMELLDFNPWLVTGIVWSTGGTTWTLTKEEGEWRRDGVEDALDGDAVHDLLADLDDLRVAAYAPDDLDPAEAGIETASIQLRQSDGLQVGLTLVSGPTRAFAAVDGEPGLREVGSEVGHAIGNHRPLSRQSDGE